MKESKENKELCKFYLLFCFFLTYFIFIFISFEQKVDKQTPFFNFWLLQRNKYILFVVCLAKLNK